MSRVLGVRAALVAAASAVAILPAAGIGATTPPPGLVYATETSQFEAMTIEVTPARNRVVKFNFGWEADCVPGPAATPTTETSVAFTEYQGGYPINAAGRWSKRLSQTFTEGQVTAVFSYVLQGLRTGAKMTGSIQATLVEKDAAGQIIRTCTSPTVKYNALEKTFFGGLTAQRNLIVVKTNLASTQVRRVRWDWEGTCTAGPAAKPETSLTHFEADFVDGPIVIRSNGSFLKVFSYQPFANPQTGLTRQYSARLVGRKAGPRINGTLTAGFLETDTATDAIVRNCTSGPIKFGTKD